MKIATIGDIHQEGIKLVSSDKDEIIIISDYSSENLKVQLKDIDAIAIRTANLSSDILEKCEKLKIVSRHGVGTDNVDVEYLNKNKIPLAITGTANAVSVAEHALMMILNLSRNVLHANNMVKSNLFHKKKSLTNIYEVYKKNILILGFGRVGKELQKRCQSFGMNILVYDPYVLEKDILALGCKKVDFDEGISQADYISLHLPSNKDTNKIISRSEFKKMKNTCFIINTARGKLINQEDLVWALNNEIIAGAGLDVYVSEPPEHNDPILSAKNTILTPHNSALTIECRIKMGIETITNILSFFEGKPILSNIVNKEVLK